MTCHCCPPREAPDDLTEYDLAPDCRFCDDRTEVYTGLTEHDTGMPITAPCPDCARTTP